MDHKNLDDMLPRVVDSLVASVHDEPKLQHLNSVHLPNRDAAVESIALLQQLMFPGFFGMEGLTNENLPLRLGELVLEASKVLYEQVRCCLRYRESLPGDVRRDEHCDDCDRKAADTVGKFFERLPQIRKLLAGDVQAAFEGDPAAHNTDETIYCYPGLFAIAVQRLAHEFHLLGVPLLPRMMTEHAHSRTGIDIHPGAKLGERFFIDHGTGVVIGETTVIGNNVKVYQGVTLGALAPGFGQRLRGQKRHPTIEDDVTIYAGTTILGGDTVIGKGSTIGGNVFITTSVPPYTLVAAEPPKLKYTDRTPKKLRKESVQGWNI